MSDFRQYSELYHTSIARKPLKYAAGIDEKWFNFLKKLSVRDCQESKELDVIFNKAWNAFPHHPEKYNPTPAEWETCQREYKRIHSPKNSLSHAGTFTKVVKDIKNKSIEQIYSEDKNRAIRMYPTLSSEDKKKLESLVLNDPENNRVKGFIEDLAKSSGKEYLVLLNKFPSSNNAAIIYGTRKDTSGRKKSDFVNRRHKR